MAQFGYKDDNYYCEGISLAKLAEEEGTPLYVYSLKALLSNCKQYRDGFQRAGADVCYAMKANGSLALAAAIAKIGFCAEVGSLGELVAAQRAGFSPRDTIVTGVGKSDYEIYAGLEAGVRCFVAESLEEVYAINSACRHLQKRAPVVFRINPDVDPKTHPAITTGKKGTKFGFDEKRVMTDIKVVRTLELIDIVGLHIHIGSQIESLDPFILGAKKLADFALKVEELGIALKFLDLGGGLGISYAGQEIPTPELVAKAVLPILSTFKAKIMVEPGRSLVGNTGILLAKALYRKESGGKRFMILDAGMNDLIRPALYGAKHKIVPLVKDSEVPMGTFNMVGPVCESDDVFLTNFQFPALEPGQYVGIKDTGAYGYAMSSNYNGRLRAKEILVSGTTYKVIRDRETPEDLLRGQIIPEFG